MSPRIETGDVVLIAPYEGEALDLGAVIVFDDPASDGRITHRVVDVTPSGDYVTRGDANGRLDSTAVAPEEIDGVGRLLVPVAAKPLVWADRGEWLLLALFVLAIGSVVWTSRWALLDRYDPWNDDFDVEPIVLRPRAAGDITPYVVVVALSLAILAFTTTRSRSVFADFTDSAANAFSAGTLQPPTGLGAVSSTPTAIDVSWTPSASTWADGYTLHRSLQRTTGFAPAATVPGQPSTGHTDTGVQPGTTHYYIGQSYASGWTSSRSNTPSATTPGLADAQRVGAWATGLTHAAEAGSDRGLVLIAGNEQRAHVHLLGGWGTGLAHAAVAGNERALIFVAGHEHATAPAPTLTSVTYGGQAMAKVDAVSVGTGSTARVEIWFLNDAGVAAATDSTFVPTWGTTPDLPMYSHAFFGGVDQAAPAPAHGVNSSPAATPNPITTAALATTSGEDMVVAGAVAGEAGSYSSQNGFALGNDQTAGSTATLGTALKLAAAATETPSMSHSGPNRQVIAGVVLNGSGTAHAPTISSISYGGQPMTKVNDVSVGSSTTASTEVWFLDEAGISAATGGAFSPIWTAAPDLPLYSHAFFTGVDQSDPIGDTDTASSPAGTPNPITTTGLTTGDGDVVVTGSVSGELGSYTPQNGFSLGNNQNAGGTYTLASAEKSAAAGAETPSMLHSAADPFRQVIAGVVLNRRRAELANSWTTGLTHTAGAGNDRMLVFVASMENGAEPGVPPQGQRDLIGVTYGGQPLTEVSDVMLCTGTVKSFCVRTEFWYLLDAGVAAATDSTFVPTWVGDAPHELEEFYTAVTLDRVHQTAPIGNVSTNTEITNPIQPADPIGVGVGDIVIVATVGGHSDSYTEPAGYTEGTDQTLLTSTLATAFLEVVADGTEQPSSSYDGTVNRQAILAATVKSVGNP